MLNDGDFIWYLPAPAALSVGPALISRERAAVQG
jgi:hypothetical protein